jgi:hypothetical protein
MNTDKYGDLGFENPYKIFKKGILPIGLALAYGETHSYDPLKACHLYLWLDRIRSFAWQWLVMGTIWILLYIPIVKQQDVKTFRQSPSTLCVIVLDIILVLFIIFTQKIYKQSRKRMWDFNGSIESFVHAFRPILEDESFAIKASTGKYELFAKISMYMIRIAGIIIQGEIIGKQVDFERLQLGHKSSVANEFGLGCEWSIYFCEARKTVDPYEIFTWEI